MKYKKSQLWYIDLIMGITIFSIMLLIAFKYITGNTVLLGTSHSDVLREAESLSQSLMTQGIPTDWNSSNVITIGLTTDYVLNTTKLMHFENLTLDDYSYTKNILGIRSDYLIYFQDKNGTILTLQNQTYIGSGVTLDDVLNMTIQDQVTLVRYVVYKQNDTAQIIAMMIMLWNEYI